MNANVFLDLWVKHVNILTIAFVAMFPVFMEELVSHLNIIMATTHANVQAPGWEISVRMMSMNAFIIHAESRVPVTIQ